MANTTEALDVRGADNNTNGSANGAATGSRTPSLPVPAELKQLVTNFRDDKMPNATLTEVATELINIGLRRAREMPEPMTPSAWDQAQDKSAK